MSLETWKAEFYPVDADKVPEDQALDHSIKKWEGLQPDNLAKHSVHLDNRRVTTINSDYMTVDSSNCALCHYFSADIGCTNCPIRVYKGTDCEDVKNSDEACLPEYSKFLQGDTKPMLQLLQAVKEKDQMRQFNQLSPEAQTTIIHAQLSAYTGDLPQHVKDEIADWKLYATTQQPIMCCMCGLSPVIQGTAGCVDCTEFAIDSTRAPVPTLQQVDQWGRPKALPCPFCGVEGYKSNGWGATRLEHKDSCYLAAYWRTKHHVIMDEQVDNWNSRTTLRPQQTPENRESDDYRVRYSPSLTDTVIPSARLEALHKVVKAATLIVDGFSRREICGDVPYRDMFSLVQALKGLENASTH